MDLPALRAKIARLVPYTRRVRPGSADSFPPFMDQELLRIDTANRDIVQALKDLDARLTALGG